VSARGNVQICVSEKNSEFRVYDNMNPKLRIIKGLLRVKRELNRSELLHAGRQFVTDLKISSALNLCIIYCIIIKDDLKKTNCVASKDSVELNEKVR
jgi:hypothetical protein